MRGEYADVAFSEMELDDDDVRAAKERRLRWWLWCLHIVCGVLEVASALVTPVSADWAPDLACYESVYTSAGDVSALPMGSMPIYTLVLVVFLTGTWEHMFCVLLVDLYEEMQQKPWMRWWRWLPSGIVLPLLVVVMGYGVGIREGYVLVGMAGLGFVAVLTRIAADLSLDGWWMLLVGDLSIIWALVPTWGVYGRRGGSETTALVVVGSILMLGVTIIPPHVMSKGPLYEIVHCVLWTLQTIAIGFLFLVATTYTI